MSYLIKIFVDAIDKHSINTIFELGSRDLVDELELYKYYNSKIYAFECNPDCLIECEKIVSHMNDKEKQNIILVDKAVSLTNGSITFYPFDRTKYDNIGASSLLKIDFRTRNKDDPSYGAPNPQKTISVVGTRLDTFIEENNISNVDMLCIDLQGYELNALKSLGDHLNKIKYIITECSIVSTYTGGALFVEVADYLLKFGFKYPDLKLTGFSEFDALFIKSF